MSRGSTSRSLNQLLRASSSLSQAQSRQVWRQKLTCTRPQIYSAIAGRAMATSTGKKLEWLIIIPDHEGAIQKRLEVRPKHLEGVMPLHEENRIIFGGAYFSHPPKEGENPPPMIGSALLAYAETKEEVLEILKNDIYTKSGVWDLSQVQIWPFKSAVRSDISTTR